VFFQLSEKQPVVLSNQPVVLLLGVFEKVGNCLSLVDLTANQTIGCFVVSTDCFFENPNIILFWWLNVL